MTTLQPRLVRADTLDLQSHAAPSAKDHTRSPTFAPYTHGVAGPHHREALRNAEESAYNERKSSPHMSMDDANSNAMNHAHQYDSTDEDGEDEQHEDPNDHTHNDGDDYEEGNDENDDDLEDDLLDKISSSPSIEDGKYSCFLWPRRVDSIGHGASPASLSTPTRGNPPVPLHASPVDSRKNRGSNDYWVSHHLSVLEHEDAWRGGDSESRLRVCLSRTMWADLQPPPYVISSAEWSGKNTVELGNVDTFSFPEDNVMSDDDLLDEISDKLDQDWVDEGEPWYEGSSSDDDSDGFQFSDDSRFIDSGWGGECLREVEDIDFEFVYALHTFVATVEGQANATKGDTMVLLDDSNSYWWLVRVVKDGSIGYLPAEHIETPTERLARLNKHRNIDLSASMLGDNPEKSKNPLKKAMKRRNAKTVTFTAPTYYEPSEYDFDSEDEEGEEVIDGVVNPQQQQTQQSGVDITQEAQQTDEPQESIIIVNGIKKVASDDQMSTDSPTSPVHTDAPGAVSTQVQTEESLQRSRNGVVRNTDSFFKDDTVETKKISLTPRLLRNDVDSTANTNDQDLRSKSSADTFDRMLGSDDKSKDKEKKKEKKGMLSGLFKRKDKTSKNTKSDAEDEKVDDVTRPAQTKDSLESVSSPQSSEKRPGKLQKHQPVATTLTKISTTEARQVPSQTANVVTPIHSPKISESITQLPETDGTLESEEMYSGATDSVRPEQAPNRFPSLTEKRSIFAPITTVLKTTHSHTGEHDTSIKPIHSKRAKERFAIDGSDSEDDATPTMSQTSVDNRAVSPIRTSQMHDLRPDSAMEVSPVEPSEQDFGGPVQEPALHTPTNLAGEHAVYGTPQSDTASTSKPSPSLATHTPSTSRSTPTWSDASLRSYMESDQDIRDLLIIVHDKSNITPVGPDHPLMGGLFMAERTRLAEMQTQLDTMLTTWISKKNPGLLGR